MDTNWHFIEATYDKVNLKMFVDLVEKASTAETGDATRSSNLRLGITGTDVAAFDGIIGEVFCCNPIPSLAQRTQTYLATKWRYQ